MRTEGRAAEARERVLNAMAVLCQGYQDNGDTEAARALLGAMLTWRRSWGNR